MRTFYFFSFHNGDQLMRANLIGVKLGVREVSYRMTHLWLVPLFFYPEQLGFRDVPVKP